MLLDNDIGSLREPGPTYHVSFPNLCENVGCLLRDENDSEGEVDTLGQNETELWVLEYTMVAHLDPDVAFVFIPWTSR